MEQNEKIQLSKVIQKMKEKAYNGNSDGNLEKILEKLQEESFMEGYYYAIEVLKNGIVKKETE